MQSALEQFRVSINRVRDMISLYRSLNSQATAVLDLSDILRASLVLAVSALDYYVHEVVTLGMLEIYHGQRPEPAIPPNKNQSAFSRFQVSLGGAKEERGSLRNIVAGLQEVENWLVKDFQQKNSPQQPYTVLMMLQALSSDVQNTLAQSRWLEDDIRKQLSYKSFQQPDKIAHAIRPISDKKLWDEVAKSLNRSAKDTKQELIAIIDRRNKIAHEADIDPTYGIGDRWAIDEYLVNDAVDFIEKVVESIHAIL